MLAPAVTTTCGVPFHLSLPRSFLKCADCFSSDVRGASTQKKESSKEERRVDEERWRRGL